MSNIKSLLTQAAELRAVGHPWEDIAEKLHRKVKTCMNWPSAHPALWTSLYREAQERRFDQTGNECHTYLINMARSKDAKQKERAITLFLKYGAQAYGRTGTMVVEVPPEPPSGNATIHRRLARRIDEVRTSVDRRRAEAGLPPASDSEFLTTWRAEAESKPPRPEPIKVYYDADGNTIPPPGESPARQAESTPTRDIVWGVVLLAVLLPGPVNRDAEALRSGARSLHASESMSIVLDASALRAPMRKAFASRLTMNIPDSAAFRAPLRKAFASRLTDLVGATAHAARELSQTVAPEAAVMPGPLYLVDAFTDRPFSGNPAGVCLPGEDRDHLWMQAVAAEMNQAETAFLRPRTDGDWDLRWFTPTLEVDLCGHATLASAHVLWESSRTPAGRPIRFHTRSGMLTCTTAGGRIEMDFPAEPAQPVQAPAEEAFALGAAPVFVGRNRLDMLVVFDSADTVRQLTPDMGQVAKIKARGVIVTARSDRPGSDFISRFFAPQSGVAEDPVTGSAHCCLGPYWRDVLGKDELVGYQASKRGGTVAVRCVGERVVLGGTAVTFMEGMIKDS